MMSVLAVLIDILNVNIHFPLLSYYDAVLFTITCALLTHFLYHKHEFQPSSFHFTFILLVVFPIIPFLFLRRHLSSIMRALMVSYAIFYTTVLASIVLYRISPLHPLAEYPGPLLAKVSKFWVVWNVLRGKHHHVIRKLHEKYGDYVRIGPNELSIADVDAIPDILGVDGMPKGPSWDARRNPDGIPSLIALRDARAHARRRKLWNRGFTSAAVKGYEPILARRALQLVEELERHMSGTGGVHEKAEAKGLEKGRKDKGRRAVDLVEWMSWFTFDVMGDVVFGGAFELMSEGDTEGIWDMMEGGLKALAVTTNIPWIMRLAFKNPQTINNVVAIREFAIRQIARRRAKNVQMKDLFYYLADEEGLEPEETSELQLLADSVIAIIAGSDTSASVLSCTFYFLATHPEAYMKLREEIDAAFPLVEVDPFDAARLAEMPYLNAILNETMRLQPPILTTLQRAPAKGSGGHVVAGHFLPEGTAVIVSPYVLMRDARHFAPAADAFIPERWLPAAARPPTLAHAVLNSTAYIPFSVGPAVCAGKNLALLQLRMTVALVLQRFDMRLAEGYDMCRWEAEMEDLFVTKLGKLPIVLTPRQV